MLTTNAFAGIGALIGDPARAAMLDALMDGRALTATELAAAAGVTPQTASSHLAQLTTAGLLAVERQGRHRYHRLANAEVAQMIEAVGSVAAKIALDRPARPRTGPRDAAMRQARTCYDHLAGRVAVAVADAMVARGHVEFGADGGALTAAGSVYLREIGIDLDAAGTGRAASESSAAHASTGPSAARISPASWARRSATISAHGNGSGRYPARARCRSRPPGGAI